MLQDNETKKRNDAARRTLAALLSQDKAINAKIREAKYDVEKAQKKLQNLQKTKEEIDEKLQALCDATATLSNTTPEREINAYENGYT